MADMTYTAYLRGRELVVQDGSGETVHSDFLFGCGDTAEANRALVLGGYLRASEWASDLDRARGDVLLARVVLIRKTGNG